MLQAGDVAGGRFRLIRPIGSGGMASVWWARHELIDRDVALKLSPAVRNEQVIGRFVREAKIIGKFQHRNIVGVVDAGELVDEGYLFLALELLRGVPFADRLIPNCPLPPAEVVAILIEVCCGLEAAHAEGVVHRDIKPENIVLAVVPGEGVVPKIVDFGISQITGSCDTLTIEGQLLGTPSYMSPEQALGSSTVDARADLWAVGVILYEALSGSAPFKADNHHAVLRRIIEAEPMPLSDAIPEQLRAIVSRCLEKDPAQRYQTAASLRADLDVVLADLNVSAPAPIMIFSQPETGLRERQAETTRPPDALVAPARNVTPASAILSSQRIRAQARWAAMTNPRDAGAAAAGVRARNRSWTLRFVGAAAFAAMLASAALKKQPDALLVARSGVGSVVGASVARSATLRLAATPVSNLKRGETGAAGDALCASRTPTASGAEGVDAASRCDAEPPRPVVRTRARRRPQITSPGF